MTLIIFFVKCVLGREPPLPILGKVTQERCRVSPWSKCSAVPQLQINRHSLAASQVPKTWTKIKLHCKFPLTTFLLWNEVNSCSFLDYVWRDLTREACLEPQQDRAGAKYSTESASKQLQLKDKRLIHQVRCHLRVTAPKNFPPAINCSPFSDGKINLHSQT